MPFFHLDTYMYANPTLQIADGFKIFIISYCNIYKWALLLSALLLLPLTTPPSCPLVSHTLRTLFSRSPGLLSPCIPPHYVDDLTHPQDPGHPVYLIYLMNHSSRECWKWQNWITTVHDTYIADMFAIWARIVGTHFSAVYKLKILCMDFSTFWKPNNNFQVQLSKKLHNKVLEQL